MEDSKNNETLKLPAQEDDNNDQHSEKAENQIMYGIKWWDICALGICIVIQGDYITWNAGLVAGFGSFMIATILVGFAYICFCFSVSELSSALPFAGGAYGLARCTLGFFPGFIIGVTETIEYIFYVSGGAIALTDMISTLNPGLAGYEPISWLVFYIALCLIYIYGGVWLWRANMLLAILSLLIVLMYCFGSMKFINLTEYAQYTDDYVTDKGWFIGGISNFMLAYPLAAFFFVGIEVLNMACDDIEEPKKNIPKGQISCIFILFITSILTLIVSSGLPPGISAIASLTYVFDIGFALMFNTDSNMTLILTIPATIASAFGFVYGFSKMIVAMGKSKLYPTFISKQHPTTKASYMAIIIGSILSYLTCIASYYNETFSLALNNICMLCAFVAYSSQCIGYIYLQTKYSNLPREFRSPFGVFGAIFSLLNWLFGIICLIFFQQDQYIAIIIYIGIVIVMSLYYFLFARSHQTFSEEERKIFLVAHIINHNSKFFCIFNSIYLYLFDFSVCYTLCLLVCL